MIRKSLLRWALPAAAATLLLLLPGTSEAQVRVGVGVSRGNVGAYYGSSPYYRGYYPGYGGYYPGYYPGYPGYGRSGVSISIGGSPGYYPGYGYSPYYTPYYSVPRYTSGYDPYYSGGSATYILQTPATEPARAANTALVEVRVPAGARVFFDGVETKQTGSRRRFVSPELEPGYDYTYMVKASWTENGKEVTQERKVVVQAGGVYPVNLTSEPLPAPAKTQP